ncbi:MAG: hypothetical protein IT350_11510 [Deltaproteobacteria bacterium]|nr:hypothetical protein [Deltaproteobacteria bacterium]
MDVVARWRPDLLIVQICGNDDDPEIPLAADPPWKWTRHSALTAFMYTLLRHHVFRDSENPSPPASGAFERLVSDLAGSRQHCLFIVFLHPPPSLNSEHMRELIGHRSDLVAMIDLPWREESSLHSSKHLNPDGYAELVSDIVRNTLVIAVTRTDKTPDS